jgi:hypothetical protein
MSTGLSPLFELQRQLREAVLGGDAGDIVADILGEGIEPAARLGIYRNHALATLGDALRRIYPVVCRLVDERFFAYATHQYLRVRPPSSRCLNEYGSDFADFLATFPPCEGLPYLADIARLEWTLKSALAKRQPKPWRADILAAIPSGEAAYVALRLQPSLNYLASPWPIDAIWRANQSDEVPTVDPASGGVNLEIRRDGEAVLWRRLDLGTFVFRKSLADERMLAAALTAANLRDAAFDPTAALRDVFAEGLVVGVAVSLGQALEMTARDGQG